MTKSAHYLNLKQVALLLQATPQTLRSELGMLDNGLLCRRPEPEAWCINEVIGHLIEADKNGFAGRIQTILKEDQPQLVAWDVADHVVTRRDFERNGFDLLDELQTMRRENTRMLVDLQPKQLARVGIHPLVGDLHVSDLIFEWVHHDRNHIKQILSNIQAFIWPDLGNAQRFFQPDLNPYL